MQPNKQVYNYGTSETQHTLAQYYKSIYDTFPKPDPIEQQVNISDYERKVVDAVKLGIIQGKEEVDVPIDLMPDLFTTAKVEPTKKFSHTKFNEISDRTWRNIKNLTELKGGEYAGDVDRLANFRNQAEELNLPMETIWAVYANKHWGAVMQYIKDIQENKYRDRMEPIEGRCDDLIVYLMLFKAMIKEREES